MPTSPENRTSVPLTSPAGTRVAGPGAPTCVTETTCVPRGSTLGEGRPSRASLLPVRGGISAGRWILRQTAMTESGRRSGEEGTAVPLPEGRPWGAL